MDGIGQGIVDGYHSVSTSIVKALDPIIEAKKKLPVYDGTCPSVSVRPDLAVITDFYDPAHPSDKSRLSSAKIMDVKNICRVEDSKIIMQLDITVAGDTGPKARVKPSDKPSFAYPYFIAVTDASGTVLSKEVFAVSLSFDSKQTQAQTTETIFQNMPFPDTGNGEMFYVVTGFQLSPEQLAYNNARGLTTPVTNPTH